MAAKKMRARPRPPAAMPAEATPAEAMPADDTERKLLTAADTALAYAEELGGTAAEASLSQGQGISVTVRRGEVETVEHHRDKSLSVTVYFGHRGGCASTTDLTPDAIRRSVAAACDIAKFTEPDDCNGLADRELLAAEFPDLQLFHPWNVQMDEAIDRAARCEQAALAADKRIRNSEGATLSSGHGVGLYANSHGFRGLSRGSEHSLGCAVIAGHGDGMQRDYWGDSARAQTDLQSPAAVGERAGARAVARLNARKVRTGEYPVIFEPEVAGSLLGHLVAAASGGSLYRKASFLLDCAGQQIFPETIRIREQPRLLKSPGGANFDAEGVATGDRELVADGVLQGYILSSYSARKLGLRTTGNAGGVRNLSIAATADEDLAAMIARMKRGVVVRELIGFGVNTVTGDYSRGAFGFWVERGKIQYPVQEFTIAGNLAQMFRDIVAVGVDADPRRNLRAGAVWVKKMTVAGQ